jgi:CNT family concentrative nucleoside transporter
LEQAHVGAIFFFDEDAVITRHWFFAGVLSAIIFFIAFVQMLYYLGVMQWVIKHLCVMDLLPLFFTIEPDLVI